MLTINNTRQRIDLLLKVNYVRGKRMVTTSLSVLSLSSAIYQAKPTGPLFSRGIGVGTELLHQSLRRVSLLCNLGETLNLSDPRILIQM